MSESLSGTVVCKMILLEYGDKIALCATESQRAVSKHSN